MPIHLRPILVMDIVEQNESLEYCTDAWDLCESLLHALLGWLGAIENGWLHCDPSIRNILRLKQPRLGCSPDPEVVAASQHHGIHSRDSELGAPFHEVLKKLKVPHECKAILIDFDLSIELEPYFTPLTGSKTLSRTTEFMSGAMRTAMRLGEEHLQTPIDDLWAFFHTAVWAALFHVDRTARTTTARETRWREQLRLDTHSGRFSATGEITKIHPKFEIKYSPTMRAMAPILQDWFLALDSKEYEWRHEMLEAAERNQEITIKDLKRLAYRGVIDFMNVMVKHRRNVEEMDPPVATDSASPLVDMQATSLADDLVGTFA